MSVVGMTGTQAPRGDWHARLTTIWSGVRSVLLSLYRARAEILLTLAMLGGWALVTWGLVLFTTWKIWPLSAGLLLLSCVGWRLLWTVVSHGLYSLTRRG